MTNMVDTKYTSSTEYDRIDPDTSHFFLRRRCSSFSMVIAMRLISKISLGNTTGPPTLSAPLKREGR